jgi:hypothetical protein
MRRRGAARIPFVNLLPETHQLVFIPSHDVKRPAPLERIEPPLEIQHRHGLISGPDLEAEDYETPPETVELIRSAGCVVGVHRLMHADTRFRNRARLETQLQGIHLYIRRGGPGRAASRRRTGTPGGCPNCAASTTACSLTLIALVREEAPRARRGAVIVSSRSRASRRCRCPSGSCPSGPRARRRAIERGRQSPRRRSGR